MEMTVWMKEHSLSLTKGLLFVDNIIDKWVCQLFKAIPSLVPRREGSGDIRLIPRASLMDYFLERNNHISATPEIRFFSTMTQHFFGA